MVSETTPKEVSTLVANIVKWTKSEESKKQKLRFFSFALNFKHSLRTVLHKSLTFYLFIFYLFSGGFVVLGSFC